MLFLGEEGEGEKKEGGGEGGKEWVCNCKGQLSFIVGGKLFPEAPKIPEYPMLLT